MRRQLSKTANVSMKKEYLLDVDRDIHIWKKLLNKAKRDVIKANKGVLYCEEQLEKLAAKRIEIKNLK